MWHRCGCTTISLIMKPTLPRDNAGDARHDVQALMRLDWKLLKAKYIDAPEALPNPPSALWMLHICQAIIKVASTSTETRETQIMILSIRKWISSSMLRFCRHMTTNHVMLAWPFWTTELCPGHTGLQTGQWTPSNHHLESIAREKCVAKILWLLWSQFEWKWWTYQKKKSCRS